ncbi:MAG: EF-P lysine aminoacylase GenX [Gammaproteobacteria bacterium]|nr:EF-P lysine aminoacylase GenX [Gammaproteobacteria bacterium]
MTSIENLKKRAQLLQKIRAFFIARDVLEVETPCLSQHTVTNPYIESWVVFPSPCPLPPVVEGNSEKIFYLQTSPEYHMKRLLAAGSGSIFQICHAFRVDAHSERHNPEFTMLEWYRINFTLNDLMDEMDELLQLIFQKQKATRYTYQAIFKKYCSFDPLSISFEALKKFAEKNINIKNFTGDRDDWLSLTFTHLIEPNLLDTIFIYDFPASQAALARLNPRDPRVASRFEVYVDALELANGFHELNNAQEQRQRFIDDNKKRQQLSLAPIELDEKFLDVLDKLPDCSGVALGVDRLAMLALDVKSIDEVIAFSIERA